VTAVFDPPDAETLLATTRRAIEASSDGLDVSAVQRDTPLAAVLFDSLSALKFIATLEAELALADLPFEQWLLEHSERADALTVGSLVEWLRHLPQLRGARTRRPGRDGAAGG
jgi:hypothetical protein